MEKALSCFISNDNARNIGRLATAAKQPLPHLYTLKTSYPIKRSPFEPPSLLSKRERLISSKRNAKSISKRMETDSQAVVPWWRIACAKETTGVLLSLRSTQKRILFLRFSSSFPPFSVKRSRAVSGTSAMFTVHFRCRFNTSQFLESRSKSIHHTRYFIPRGNFQPDDFLEKR